MAKDYEVIKFKDFIGEDEWEGVFVESEEKGTLLYVRAKKSRSDK